MISDFTPRTPSYYCYASDVYQSEEITAAPSLSGSQYPSASPSFTPSQITDTPSIAPSKPPVTDCTFIGNGVCLDESGKQYDYIGTNGITSVSDCVTFCQTSLSAENLLSSYVGFNHNDNNSCFCYVTDNKIPDSAANKYLFVGTFFLGNSAVDSVLSIRNYNFYCYSYDPYDDTTAPSQAPTESLAPTVDRSVQGFSYVGQGYCLDSNLDGYDYFAVPVNLTECGPFCAASAGNSIEQLVGFEFVESLTFCLCLFLDGSLPSTVNNIPFLLESSDSSIGNSSIAYTSGLGSDFSCYEYNSFGPPRSEYALVGPGACVDGFGDVYDRYYFDSPTVQNCANFCWRYKESSGAFHTGFYYDQLSEQCSCLYTSGHLANPSSAFPLPFFTEQTAANSQYAIQGALPDDTAKSCYVNTLFRPSVTNFTFVGDGQCLDAKKQFYDYFEEYMLLPAMCGLFCESYLGSSVNEFVGFSFGFDGLCKCYFTNGNVPTSQSFQTTDSFQGNTAIAYTTDDQFDICYKNDFFGLQTVGHSFVGNGVCQDRFGKDYDFFETNNVANVDACNSYCTNNQGTKKAYYVGFEYETKTSECLCLYIEDNLPASQSGETYRDDSQTGKTEILSVDTSRGDEYLCYKTTTFVDTISSYGYVGAGQCQDNDGVHYDEFYIFSPNVAMCVEFCLTTQGSQYDFHVGFMYNKEDLTCACLYINDKLPTTPLGATMVDLNPGSTEQIGGTDGTSGFVCYKNHAFAPSPAPSESPSNSMSATSFPTTLMPTNSKSSKKSKVRKVREV
ncbi:hypothetical protein ACHAXS_003839 [Conticribra weissflogii]